MVISPFYSLLTGVCFICPMSRRYSTNWDRKGWPGSEIQMYYCCPWHLTKLLSLFSDSKNMKSDDGENRVLYHLNSIYSINRLKKNTENNIVDFNKKASLFDIISIIFLKNIGRTSKFRKSLRKKNTMFFFICKLEIFH